MQITILRLFLATELYICLSMGIFRLRRNLDTKRKYIITYSVWDEYGEWNNPFEDKVYKDDIDFLVGIIVALINI